MRKRLTGLSLMTFVAVAFAATSPASSLALQSNAVAQRTKTLPTEIADSTFWRIVTQFSENEQPFTTYMVSNEIRYPDLITALLRLNSTGGAYIGVAPEQNYHYIAAIRPQIAFILDIRRQAIVQHLMFKAVFELSPTRSEFISLLFTKPLQSSTTPAMTAFQTWTAYWYVATDTTRFTANFTRILDHLRKKHNFALTAYDSASLHYTYGSFYSSGPNIVSNGGSSSNDAMPSTFGNLTSAVDSAGRERSFLANEEGYQAVRQLHLKNLIIPITGDFAGTHALRTIGSYLNEHNAQLTAFYLSNVESYLSRDGKAPAFYANVGTLPLSAKSVFLRGSGQPCYIQAFLTTSRCF